MPFAAFRDRNEIRIFSLLAIVCGFYLSFGPGRTQGARVIAHARALLHEGRNTIDTCHWNTIDKVICRGHYFTCAAPGMGYLAVAPLAVFEGFYALVPASACRALDARARAQLQRQCQPLIDAGCLSFDPKFNSVDVFEFHAAIWFFELLIALLLAASAVIFYRVLLLFDVPDGLAGHAALVLGVGTILFFYARIPYALVPTAFCLLSAFYLLVRVGKEPPASSPTQSRRLVVAGLMLGLAVAMEYIQIIGAGLVFLYAWRKVGTRRVWRVAAGGLPVGLLIMWYHHAAFGDALAFPYKFAIPIIAVDHGQTVLAVDHPTWERLAAVTIGVRRGLFIYNPVLLLLGWLLVDDLLRRRRQVAESLLGLALMAGYLIFQASSPLASVTWGIGPRYAAAVVPFLMLGVIFVKTPLRRKAFYGLAAVSGLANWLMVQRDIEPQHHAFPMADAALALLRSGPSCSLQELALSAAGLATPAISWLAGVAAHAALAGLLWYIWRRTKEPSACP